MSFPKQKVEKRPEGAFSVKAAGPARLPFVCHLMLGKIWRAARATKTKPRLGSEPGQSKSYCGQSRQELQAAGENGLFGAFRRCNPLKPAISHRKAVAALPHPKDACADCGFSGIRLRRDTTGR
ncbi:hypothetical protein [Achromobacter animicus]|uniref:hypothetical protein n=1 Tax=Achromobacter animicus TaxID=1389935 RepID=UPI0028AC5EFF|nr:hypothetical protein [Achromobacter animicus]